MKVSANAYAKHRGVSLQAVLRAIREGRLSASAQQRETGRWDIDPELADEEWRQNTDSGQGAPAHAKNRRQLSEPQEDSGDQPMSYADARAQHERFKARLAQLELEEREGKLVQADAVKQEAFRVARIVRDAMLNLPDRIAAELAAETNQFKVHQRLTKEIRRALEGLKLDD